MIEATETTELRFVATRSTGEVSAVLVRPDAARCLLVLGHGAGTGMRHQFMEALVEQLARDHVATLRYQFPYTEHGRKQPDPPPILMATVRSAVRAAGQSVSDLPIIAGGKSMGGRMTSMAAAKEPLAGVRGLVFFGFPLHPAGNPGTDRAAHLSDVTVPMLFLQGTRDNLADLPLLEPVCRELGPKAKLHIVEGADHSFHVLKRSGRTDEEVLEELSAATRAWADELS
jgi:predicted alpha/beta-hydrolase family hydrolase